MSLYSTIQFLFKHPLTKDRPIPTLWRFGTWQLHSRLFSTPKVVPWIGDTKLWIKRGWTGVTGNYYTGLHEFEDMAFLLHVLRPGDVFVDAGANMGTYTVLASGVCGAYSYSFEPVQATFERLQENIALNHLQKRTTAIQCALGSSTGEIKFTYQQDTTNHVATEQDKDFVSVPVKRLDEVVPQTPVLIKIDVEGFETEVIRGATQHLNNPALKAIIIELNGSGERYGYNEKAIHEQFLELGFQAYSYEPFQRRLSAMAQFGNLNTIYCRDLEWVKARLVNADSIEVRQYSL
jgi:FkbM family methyltransferase